jgi:hypothetical protein
MSQGSKECVDLLQCECGSTELCIASRTPVFVYMRARRIVRVEVTDDEEHLPGGVARCLTCDRYWIVDCRPAVGDGAAWELGRSPESSQESDVP